MFLLENNALYLNLPLWIIIKTFNVAKLAISVNHSLGQQEALRRIKLYLDSAQVQYAKDIKEVNFKWTGALSEFSFKVAKVSLSGNLTVYGDSLKITGKIPLALILFKSQIEKTVRQQVDIVLKK